MLGILYIYLSTLTLVILSKRRFGEVLPFSFIISVLLVYIGGLLERIGIGFYLSLLLPLASIPLLILNRDKLKEIKDNYFTLTFILFSIIVPLVLYYFRNKTLTSIDEFSHWGLMVKEIFRLGRLYCVDEAKLLVHKDYPPFPALLNYLYCRLRGGYSEPYLFQITTLFTLSLFMPLGEIKNKKKYLIIPLLLFYALGLETVSLLNETNQTALASNLFCILIDYPLSILGGLACIYAYKVSKDNDLINNISFTLLLSTILFSKQIGIAFYGLAFLVYISSLILNKQKINILNTILIFVLPFILLYSYKLYSSRFALNIEFSLKDQLNIRSIIDLFIFRKGKDYQLITLNNYFEAINNKGLIYNINISYIPLNIIFTIVIFIGVYLYSKKIKDSLVYSLIYLFGAFAYMMTMLVLYCFSFDEYFGPALMCFLRYMNEYNYFGLFIIIALAILIIDKHKLSYLFNIILVIFMIYTSIPTLPHLIPLKEKTYIKDTYDKYFIAKDKISSSIDKGRILIIESNVYEDRSLNNILNYDMDNYSFNSLVNNEISDFTAIYELDLTVEDFKEILKNYDYIYVYDYDVYFYDNLWTKTTDTLLEINRLYRIENEEIHWFS